MNKLIICGSRTFKDWAIFNREWVKWFDDHDPEYSHTEIISGMAEGPDEMGWLTACDYGLKCWQFEPNWAEYGNVGGHLRNQEMAVQGTHVLAFWDGVSKGTQDMLTRAAVLGLDRRVITVKRQPVKPVKKVKTLF